MDFDDFSFPAGAAPQSPPSRAQAAQEESLPLPPLQSPQTRALAPQRAPAPVAARAKAGLGIIAAAAGAGVGGVLGGPFGAAAGFAGVGALRNLYRAQGIASSDPAERGDAARSVALCVVGFALAGYLGYKAFSAKDD